MTQENLVFSMVWPGLRAASALASQPGRSYDPPRFIRYLDQIKMSFGTRLFTWLHGEFVGSDEFGNRYYLDKRTKGAKRERRWVLYKGEAEASRVPPEWHGWLHATMAKPPLQPAQRYQWQQPHQPNLTGTDQAYRPPGHVLQGGKRPKVSGDYEPWSPG